MKFKPVFAHPSNSFSIHLDITFFTSQAVFFTLLYKLKGCVGMIYEFWLGSSKHEIHGICRWKWISGYNKVIHLLPLWVVWVQHHPMTTLLRMCCWLFIMSLVMRNYFFMLIHYVISWSKLLTHTGFHCQHTMPQHVSCGTSVISGTSSTEGGPQRNVYTL
jgi:hypothetical protein